MNLDIVFVFILALIAIVLFITELLSADLVAILIMSLVAVLGIISPEDAVSGFSNPATLTVMNMFILSTAVFKTGALNKLGKNILKISKGSQLKATILTDYLLIFLKYQKVVS